MERRAIHKRYASKENGLTPDGTKSHIRTSV